LDYLIGMAQNGAILNMIKAEQEDITPNYLNKKLESMMAAVFDHIGETEERMKNLEKELFKLRNENKTEAT
jgi:hypothetical protein